MPEITRTEMNYTVHEDGNEKESGQLRRGVAAPGHLRRHTLDTRVVHDGLEDTGIHTARMRQSREGHSIVSVVACGKGGEYSAILANSGRNERQWLHKRTLSRRTRNLIRS